MGVLKTEAYEKGSIRNTMKAVPLKEIMFILAEDEEGRVFHREIEEKEKRRKKEKRGYAPLSCKNTNPNTESRNEYRPPFYTALASLPKPFTVRCSRLTGKECRCCSPPPCIVGKQGNAAAWGSVTEGGRHTGSRGRRGDTPPPTCYREDVGELLHHRHRTLVAVDEKEGGETSTA
nr:hypothetical protein Iba_chr09cCG5780 [Ipomoea batatas]